MSNDVPITPKEVRKQLTVPAAYIRAINNLLLEPDNWTKITKSLITEAMERVFKNEEYYPCTYRIDLQSIAALYRDYGWNVHVDPDLSGGVYRLIFSEER